MSGPKQCRSCGGFCGGGYGNKFCQQEVDMDPATREIEITPAMFEAGRKAYQEHIRQSGGRQIEAIYKAMRRAELQHSEDKKK